MRKYSLMGCTLFLEMCDIKTELFSPQTDFLLPAGQPEKQKEASKKHKALAAKTGGMNDFATLLNVFQSCKDR